ncbi:MAG: S-layer homology domain-containing protein, partial [Eubacteriales bacterium]|nr:S-layer homology domain-containing protein [Eubacteriales bacterium]
LEIDATSKDKKGVNTAEINLPKASVDAVAGEKNVFTTIKTDLGDIVIDPDVMAAFAESGGGDVKISITKTDPSSLDEETRKAIGDRPVLDITVTVDGKKMSTFGGSRIRSDVPYTPKSGENGRMLLMFYLDGKDAGKPVKLSLFKEGNDSLAMKVPHLSLYGVGYSNVTFADISSHWAKSSIEFLAAREILKGKTASQFDPEGKVTRAEYVTMLANSVDGIEPEKAAAAGFEDISSAAWYASYVNWAVAEGIVKGYSDGNFRPEEKITREQMAVMTDAFLKAMDLEVDAVNKKVEFTDQTKINTWSSAAVTAMQQQGIIRGTTDGSFAPQDTATRAQAAAILKAYIEALLK